MIANILCSILLMTGTPTFATAGTTATNIQDSVITDSISRAPSDKQCSVELVIDYPEKGAQPLTDSLRSYINREAQSFYMARLDGDGMPRSAEYKGQLNDGKALVDFYAESILKDMQDMYHEFVDTTGAKDLYLMNQSSIRKTSENDSIVTFEASSYQFEGGAHGQYWLEGATFRKSDGTRVEIRLDPFTVNDMQPLLRAGLEQYLQDNGAETTVEELMKGGIFMSDGIIPLPSSEPYLTADGVKFVYQEYEIGPYAIGLPTFTIPLDKLTPYLSKEEKSDGDTDGDDD